jgi:hypothetical protein
MTAELSLATKAMLDDVTPGATPGVLPAQCGQSHTQITGRKYAELIAKTPAGAAIIGDAYNRSDLVGHST